MYSENLINLIIIVEEKNALRNIWLKKIWQFNLFKLFKVTWRRNET